MVERITIELFPSRDYCALRQIYFGLLWITLNHQRGPANYQLFQPSGIPRITPICPELRRITRITADYQFGSPSGPADYQSGFSLGITADYAGLPQFTLDYSKYPDLLGLLWITSIYFGLRRITAVYLGLPEFFQPWGLLRITRVVSSSWLPRITPGHSGWLELPRFLLDYYRLLRFTVDNSGLPWITKWSGELPVVSTVGNTADYSDLPRITAIYSGLRRISRITPDYQFGSPSGPANYQSGFSLGITADYARLPQITLDYPKYLDLLGLLWLTSIYFWLLRINADELGLPELFQPSGLLRITRVVSSSWLPRIMPNHSGLLELPRFT